MAEQRFHAPSPATVRAGPLRWMLLVYLVSAVGVALQRTLLSTENNFLILRAAFRHLVAGQDLYAAYPDLHADFFKYSPTFALLFAPFALLPLVPAYICWALLCAFAVHAGMSRLLPVRQAVLALALAWLAVVGDLQRAQSNAFCAGLMLVAWAAMERRHQWTAAGATAAATFVKIFPVAALAAAIFQPRKWRFAGVFAVVMLAFALLPLIVTSPAALAMQYRSWRAIESVDTLPLQGYGLNGAGLYGGLMGLLRIWFGAQWPHWPLQVAGLVVLLAPLLVRRDRWGDGLFRVKFMASVLVFCVLFNHQAESPSYAIAMIGMAVWFATAAPARWRLVLMAIAFIVVNLGSTDLMPREWYRAFYVGYAIKTVPLIPAWLVMQLELLGAIRDAGRGDGFTPPRDGRLAGASAPSKRGESDERDVAAAKALTGRG